MNTTLALTKASIRMFLRSRQALFFSLFMPFIIMVIFGYIGFDRPPTIETGLVTHAPNTQTAAFLDSIRKIPTLSLHEGTLDELQAQMNEGNLSVILDVPGDVLPPQSNTQAAKKIDVYENAGKIGEAQTVLSILSQSIDKMTIASSGSQPLVALEEHSVNAHNLRYIDFLLPGLIALSIMQMSVFSVAFVFAQYKEKGVLKRLLATPMLPYQFVTANVITRLLVSLSQTLIFILVGTLLFHTQIVGSYVLLSLCVILGAVMFLGLGFSISGLAKTVDSVPAIGNLVVFPMLFLGGTFFPISNMPSWLQAFAKLLPLTFFSTALREVMTRGSGFGDIKWDLLGMLIWAVILIFLATVTFRFQERDSV